jgi:hypothetical protein
MALLSGVVKNLNLKSNTDLRELYKGFFEPLIEGTKKMSEPNNEEFAFLGQLADAVRFYKDISFHNNQLKNKIAVLIDALKSHEQNLIEVKIELIDSQIAAFYQ